MGDAFFFSRVDEVWRAKRKACSHAFYKDRLMEMLEIFKGKMNASCSRWLKEIREKGHVDIDLFYSSHEVLMRNMIHISFGEDLYDQEVEVWVLTDVAGKSPMVLKRFGFG